MFYKIANFFLRVSIPIFLSSGLGISGLQKVLATELDLQHYQSASGEIQLFFDGNAIDPYFSTKALITAHELKLDIDKAARKWIAWLLPRQDKEGLFYRYCLKGGSWQQCSPADADDSMAALWVQLLTIVSDGRPMPESWANSAKLSLKVLSTLKNKKNLYEISKTHHAALLMDNCEVYSGLYQYAKYLEKTKQIEDARLVYEEATNLKSTIFKEFRKPSSQYYLISSEASLGDKKFYPDHVAQLFPALHGIKPPANISDWTFERWAGLYVRQWLSFTQDHYPWGLVAVAAYREGTFSWAQTWILTAKKFRHTDRWNVLEEAIYQGLSKQLFVTY